MTTDELGGTGSDLSVSEFLDAESRAALRWFAGCLSEATQNLAKAGALLPASSPAESLAIRQRQARLFYESDLYRELVERYPTELELMTIGGVECEVFTPANGLSEGYPDRLLINLHGGEFMHGARISSHLESMPIVAAGSFRVVSVDYRLAPEHRFPAATEDVLSVYGALIKDCPPRKIGIFGSSAGALLTAQFLARLQEEGLPQPAAAGMLFGAACYWRSGDSGRFTKGATGSPPSGLERELYFAGIDPSDPSAFPGNSAEMLAKFPPTLLISSTRDFALSSVSHVHSRLVKIGVESELHVWEGLDHVFHYNPALPASGEVHEVTNRFFDRHLDTP